jgi:glycerol-3-phosphate acyltransferase PlsY
MTVHREQNMKREDQQYATIRCLLLTSVSKCFGHHYAHLQENKGRVNAFGVLFWFCWMWLVAVVGAALQDASTARILQRSAPPPLPTTSNRTSTVHHMQ